jgi:hypothetical protein
MSYRLNVDMWHPVHPETQKIHRLSRGDEVPDWALDNEGIDIDALTTGARNPLFVKDESDVRAATPGTQPGKELSENAGVRSESPKQGVDKK